MRDDDHGRVRKDVGDEVESQNHAFSGRLVPFAAVQAVQIGSGGARHLVWLPELDNRLKEMQ